MHEFPVQPVIIIGAARSGTKFFRDLLLESPEVCGIPYDVSYIWRYGNEDYPDEALPVSRLDDKKVSYIRQTLLRMADAKPGKHRFLVEKTVGNTLRVPFVRAVFPEAKFIHLVRDGRAVTESAMRMWEQPPEVSYLLKKLKYFPWRNYRYAFRYAFNLLQGKFAAGRPQRVWGPRYTGIEHDVATLPLLRVCANQWHASVSRATAGLADLPASKVLQIHYEVLVSSSTIIKHVSKFIGLADTLEVLSAYENRLQIETIDKWKDRFSETEQLILKEVLSDMLQQYGYIP